MILKQSLSFILLSLTSFFLLLFSSLFLPFSYSLAFFGAVYGQFVLVSQFLNLDN